MRKTLKVANKMYAKYETFDAFDFFEILKCSLR